MVRYKPVNAAPAAIAAMARSTGPNRRAFSSETTARMATTSKVVAPDACAPRSRPRLRSSLAHVLSYECWVSAMVSEMLAREPKSAAAAASLPLPGGSRSVVHEERLELSRVAPPEPKSGAFANSATRAWGAEHTTRGGVDLRGSGAWRWRIGAGGRLGRIRDRRAVRRRRSRCWQPNR